MAGGNGPNNGNRAASSARQHVTDTITILAGGTLFSREIFSENLPTFNVWLLQTAGPLGVTVELQIVQGFGAGGQDYQLLASPFLLAVGVPSTSNWKQGARRYRAQFLAPLGNAVTLRYVFTATL